MLTFHLLNIITKYYKTREEENKKEYGKEKMKRNVDLPPTQ